MRANQSSGGQVFLQPVSQDDFLAGPPQIVTVRMAVVEALQTLDRCEFELGLGPAMGHLDRLLQKLLGAMTLDLPRE